MIQELRVKNFAIIDSLSLVFDSGLTILTGETGAGKSIIVGALGLLMGGRVSADLVRTESREAVVEALFDISAYPEILELLSSWDIQAEGGQIIIRRTISRNGKNKIFIQDRMATLHMLAQIGPRLVDISGQYSQQLLLHTEHHGDILDSFGGIMHERRDFQAELAAYQRALHEMQSLVAQKREREQRKDLLAYQRDELERAALSPQEEEDLQRERKILSSGRTLYEKTYGSYAVLYEQEGACIGRLSQVLKEIDSAAAIDGDLAGVRDRLQSAFAEVEDAAFSLRNYAESLNLDQTRLEIVDERLDVLHRLKKKYEKSIPEIIAYFQDIQVELDGISESDEKIEQLRSLLTGRAALLWKKAESLSRKRKKAAAALKTLVEKELAKVGMEKATFETVLQRAEKPPGEDSDCSVEGLSEKGMDTVEFYIAANQGEEVKPLSKIASGGEISRIVLAIKSILAVNYRVPVLLFDEVDAGIGGAVAESVGAKLKELAASHQVLCITHLPQIACFGSCHYMVEKRVERGRTLTGVSVLDDEGRLKEIARMLAGKNISEKTKEHAREMLCAASVARA